MNFLFTIEWIILIRIIIGEQEWNYDKFGPDVWGKYFKDCNGINQSPINIKTACTTYQKFEPFSFSSLFTEEINFTLTNNGHTIVAEQNRSSIITISGGNLNGFYFLENFHLHWGPNENVGSEHQINGVKYTGESHFFFRHNQTNESVVLAFFMKDEDENDFISKEKFKRTNEWAKYFNLTQYLIAIKQEKI